MNILGLKSNDATLELQLGPVNGEVITKLEELGRSMSAEILSSVSTFLAEHNMSIQEIEGFVIYGGPGSFTGLRISHSVANALSYATGKPLVQKGGENWFSEGTEALKRGENEKVALPIYGGEPNITAPKK